MLSCDEFISLEFESVNFSFMWMKLFDSSFSTCNFTRGVEESKRVLDDSVLPCDEFLSLELKSVNVSFMWMKFFNSSVNTRNFTRGVEESKRSYAL